MLIYILSYIAIVIVFSLLVAVISLRAMDAPYDIEALICGADIANFTLLNS